MSFPEVLGFGIFRVRVRGLMAMALKRGRVWCAASGVSVVVLLLTVNAGMKRVYAHEEDGDYLLGKPGMERMRRKKGKRRYVSVCCRSWRRD